MTDLPLFRATERQATRTATADAAYAAMPRGMKGEVLAALREQPRSVDELMMDLRMSHQSCSASVNRLMRDGWVWDAGVRTVTRAGRSAIVWHVRDTPQPIRSAAPTRAELQERIDAAVAALGSNRAPVEIMEILKGER